jgi:hypothetical protein
LFGEDAGYKIVRVRLELNKIFNSSEALFGKLLIVEHAETLVIEVINPFLLHPTQPTVHSFQLV